MIGLVKELDATRTARKLEQILIQVMNSQIDEPSVEKFCKKFIYPYYLDEHRRFNQTPNPLIKAYFG